MESHNYLGDYTESFRSELDNIPDKDKQLIFSKMRQLLEADDPRQVTGAKKLREKRFAGMYRLRAGNYRVFFQVIDKAVIHLDFQYRGTITFITVGNRSDIYN